MRRFPHAEFGHIYTYIYTYIHTSWIRNVPPACPEVSVWYSSLSLSSFYNYALPLLRPLGCLLLPVRLLFLCPPARFFVRCFFYGVRDEFLTMWCLVAGQLVFGGGSAGMRYRVSWCLVTGRVGNSLRCNGNASHRGCTTFVLFAKVVQLPSSPEGGAGLA